MHSFSNKKELDHGFLQVDETTDYAGKIKNVTLWYFPNDNESSLYDWQSQINFEIQSYSESGQIQKVKIWEFRSRTVNQGYGTIVLRQFLDYFKEKQSQSILVIGALSDLDERDELNRQRRDHVYQKLGFEICNGWVKTVIN